MCVRHPYAPLMRDFFCTPLFRWHPQHCIEDLWLQVLVAAGQHGVEEVAQQLARAAQASPPTRASPAMGEPVFRDAHHPAVQGCITVPPSDRALLGAPCSIGETGIALGNLAAGAPPQVWNRVNAVLNVGAVQHSGCAIALLLLPDPQCLLSAISHSVLMVLQDETSWRPAG